MTDKYLISQLQSLKTIEPRKDWVVLTKSRILETDTKTQPENKSVIHILANFVAELERGERFVFHHKLAFSSILIVVIFFGLFGFVQNSVPGDSLFTLKRITEESQAVFVKDKISFNFDIASRRLDDLKKIAEANAVDKLAPALNEYNETVSKALNGLTAVKETDVKKIASIIEKENTLGDYFGVEINDDKYAELVGREIDSLKKQTNLTSEQQANLLEAEKYFNQAEYASALEKILLIEK